MGGLVPHFYLDSWETVAQPRGIRYREGCMGYGGPRGLQTANQMTQSWAGQLGFASFLECVRGSHIAYNGLISLMPWFYLPLEEEGWRERGSQLPEFKPGKIEFTHKWLILCLMPLSRMGHDIEMRVKKLDCYIPCTPALLWLESLHPQEHFFSNKQILLGGW